METNSVRVVPTGYPPDQRWVWPPLLYALVFVLIGHAAEAQTLAHKGWAGSGIKVDPWWRHAVFYEIDPLTFQDSDGNGFGDFNGITSRLDYLQRLSVDAIVLSPFQLDVRAKARAAFDPLYGTEEDFDRLQRETSLRHMRVLIDFDPSLSVSTEDMLATARSWLSRGVAGLLVGDAPKDHLDATEADRQARLRMLRKLCAGFAGDRVLIAAVRDSHQESLVESRRLPAAQRRLPTADVRLTSRTQGRNGVQLTINDGLILASSSSSSVLEDAFKARIQSAPGTTLLVSDSARHARSFDRLSAGPSGNGAMAKLLATRLLLGRETPMLYFGQEIGMSGDGSLPQPMQWGGDPGFTSGMPWIEMGPNAETANVAAEEADPGSLLNWYRTLGQLRHNEAALRGGSLSEIEMGSPDTVAWVWQAGSRGVAANEAAVVVVCNVSAHPTAAALSYGLRGSWLSARKVHAVAQSTDEAAPALSAGVLKLPAYGVWVGELRQPGLEAAPAPSLPRHHRGR